MTKVLGPFGSENYVEAIPPVYRDGKEALLPTFDEPATYELVPFAEFSVWWEPEKPKESHRLYAQTIEIEVTGWPVISLETFNIRFLDFFGRAMGELGGRFKMLKDDDDVKVKLELDFPSREWTPYIQSLTLDMNIGFYGFFEKFGEAIGLPYPSFRSVTIREGELVILHKQEYDISKFEHPIFYIGFEINSVRAVLSDGQERTIPYEINPLWHDEYEFPPSVKGMELGEIEQHFYRVGIDLTLELDNRIYHENSGLHIKITNLTDNVLDFLGDRYDIHFNKWIEGEGRWSGSIWVETETISLPPKQSYMFSYRIEELVHEIKQKMWEDLLPLPGRYRVVCHNSSAEFYIQ